MDVELWGNGGWQVDFSEGCSATAETGAGGNQNEDSGGGSAEFVRIKSGILAG